MSEPHGCNDFGRGCCCKYCLAAHDASRAPEAVSEERENADPWLVIRDAVRYGREHPEVNEGEIADSGVKAADLEALADRIVDAVLRPVAPTANQPDTAAVAEGLAIMDYALEATNG